VFITTQAYRARFVHLIMGLFSPNNDFESIDASLPVNFLLVPFNLS